MKKILLMNNSLSTGGITASMINAANELSKLYEVSIYCYIPDGELKNRLSEKVHIIDTTWRLMAMNSTLPETRMMGTKQFVWKIFSRIWSTLFNNRLPIAIAQKYQPNLGSFDVACSYTHEAGKNIEYTGLIRILINKVDAPIKLSWVHCDYFKQKQSDFNDIYFNRVDGIVGVTKSVAGAFEATHPGVHTKIYSCLNMLDYDNIYGLSLINNRSIKRDGVVCFSACRLSWIKGIERMIDSTHDIYMKNNVYWYIAGEGPERQKIEKKIEEYGLQQHIILLGHQDNPFAFMRQADLYISASYEEAAPLVYLEAKALHLPVFSTRTLSTDELLDKNVDFICDNNDKAIRAIFDDATSDKYKLSDRKHLLDNYVGTNDQSISHFAEWIEMSEKKEKGN